VTRSRGLTRRIAALAGAAVLAGCSTKSAATGGPASPAGSGTVGYVRMEELVERHPLYDQLARYDRSIEAFDLTATAPRAAAADPRVLRQEQELERELSSAADRTKKLLNEKQQQYQAQEAQAIAAALRGTAAGGPSAAQIAGAVNATARQQQSGVASQAQRDLQSYHVTLQKQDQLQIAAAQKALAERADRTYRAQAEDLQAKESALQLRLANEDAAQRLALRTKLSSLALDDAAHDDAQKQLAALDRREADAFAAQRNRDTVTLAALQAKLHQQVQHELDAQVAAIQKHALGSLAQRQATLARGVQAAAAPAGVPPALASPGNLSPALRTRIQALHDDYQRRFQDDAKTTVADFNKTREDLSRRYAELHGVDVSARDGAQAQIVELRKKRDDLYGQITAQIDREVRVVAQARGVSTVISSVAPAGGVDLTADAMKDIETLHE